MTLRILQSVSGVRYDSDLFEALPPFVALSGLRNLVTVW